MTPNILTADPGERSGFCMLSGSLSIGEVFQVEGTGMEDAQNVLRGLLQPGIVVIEMCSSGGWGKRYDTLWKLGVRAGVWRCLAIQAGFKVHYVHPDKWQRARLYSGKNPGSDALKELSILRAKAELGKVLTHNEADAFNMLQYVAVELELGREPWVK
jgi:hypothetical protein